MYPKIQGGMTEGNPKGQVKAPPSSKSTNLSVKFVRQCARDATLICLVIVDLVIGPRTACK
jgi:hypothetical protein